MKTLLILLAALLLSAPIIGCEAHGRVGDTDHDAGASGHVDVDRH